MTDDLAAEIQETIDEVMEYAEGPMREELHGAKYQAAAAGPEHLTRDALAYDADVDIDDGTRRKLENYLAMVEAAASNPDAERRFDQMMNVFDSAYAAFDHYGFWDEDMLGGGPGEGPDDTSPTGPGPDDTGPGPDDGGPDDTGPDDGPDDPDGDDDYDRGRALDVDVEVFDTGDATASIDDPLDPEYGVAIHAEADTRSEARDYMVEALTESDRLGLRAFERSSGDAREDAYDLSRYDTEAAVERFIDDELNSRARRMRDSGGPYGRYTIEFPAVHSDVPLPIEEEGVYRVEAGLLQDVPGGSRLYDGAGGNSEWFAVGEPEGPEGGIDVLIHRGEATDEEEELTAQQLGAAGEGLVSSFFSMFNSTATPNYTVEFRKDGADADDLRAYLEDLDEITLKVVESEDRVYTREDGYRPVEAGTEMEVSMEYDRAADAFRAGGTLIPVEFHGNSAYIDSFDDADVIEHTFEEGGQYDLGIEVEDGGELVNRTWGGFDIGGYSRWEIARDIGVTAAYLNHGGFPPEEGEEDEETDDRLIAQAHQGVKQRGGVMGAINQFFQMSPSHISDEMMSRFLGNYPPFSLIPGVKND